MGTVVDGSQQLGAVTLTEGGYSGVYHISVDVESTGSGNAAVGRGGSGTLSPGGNLMTAGEQLTFSNAQLTFVSGDDLFQFDGFTGLRIGNLSGSETVTANEITIADGNSGEGGGGSFAPTAPFNLASSAVVTSISGGMSVNVVDAQFSKIELGIEALAAASINYGLAPLEVVFDGSGSSSVTNMVSYTWDFGDGNSASGLTVTNTYLSPGVYTPQLAVVDSEGRSHSNAVKITVVDEISPNILFIIADDQSPYDLKIYDPDSKLETPTIDSLAAGGVVLDGAYQMGAWSGGVCTPSRHMIMSGRTVWCIPDKPGYGRNPNEADETLVPPDLANYTLAALFNEAGYDTMRTCKDGNSYAAANAQFSVVRDATKRGNTDESGSGWHATQVLDYLSEREANNDAEPFLIYYGFSHPHDTRNGKPELLVKYGAVNHADRTSLPAAHTNQPPLPANYLPAHPFDNTDLSVRDEVSVSGVWTNRDENTIRNELGREFACSENIDIQIAKVLDKLEEMGELDNTYIFYTADHGMAIGRHGLQGKQNLYDHTWRVPFIVKGPGIPAGTRAQGNVYLLDVLATLCELTEVPIPETNQGKSFASVLKGEQETVRDVLYGAYCGGAKPGMRAVKRGNWKLIKYEDETSGFRKTQLFNLDENPEELLLEHHDPAVVALTGYQPLINQVNLADDPAYAAKRAELEGLLLMTMLEHYDPYQFSDVNYEDYIAEFATSGLWSSNGNVYTEFSGIVGADYLVEWNDSLTGSNDWIIVSNFQPLETAPVSISAPATNSTGLYRVLWLP